MKEIPDFVHVRREGVAKGCPAVHGRCPSCGNRSLFLGAGSHVTCANLRCKEPCVVSDLLDRGPGWHEQHQAAS